jgi:hypothetical protein
LLELMSKLNDVTKLEVEVFDNKLLVGNAILNSFIGNLVGSGFVDLEFPTTLPNTFVSLERLVSFIKGYTATELDAVIISWKEKVRHDLVRPPTIIKKWRSNITTWAPGGVQTFPAANFEAYKRIMPHSEYVSGTSCIFQAVEDYIEEYMIGLGLDPTFPVAFDPFPPGSSNVEPGVVPAEAVTLLYPSIAAMNTKGSVSRLNGGIHYEQSITQGKILCKGIGNHTAAGTFALYRGMAAN